MLLFPSSSHTRHSIFSCHASSACLPLHRLAPLQNALALNFSLAKSPHGTFNSHSVPILPSPYYLPVFSPLHSYNLALYTSYRMNGVMLSLSCEIAILLGQNRQVSAVCDMIFGIIKMSFISVLMCYFRGTTKTEALPSVFSASSMEVGIWWALINACWMNEPCLASFHMPPVLPCCVL